MKDKKKNKRQKGKKTEAFDIHGNNTQEMEVDTTNNIRYDKRGRRKYTLKERVLRIYDLYDELIFCKLASQDSSKCRYIKPATGKIGVDFLGTHEGENITFYYTVASLPQQIYIDWKERLRDGCKNGVRVTFINSIRRHAIAWESPQMQSRLRILRQVREEEDNKDIDAYNMHSNIQGLTKQRWIEDSLLYLAEADKNRGRALFKSTQFVIVAGKRGDDFDDSIKLMESTAANLGIKLNRVMYEIPDTLEYYSPFKHEMKPNIVDTVPSYVLTDELLARFTTYTQGTLGINGLYFGTDIYSRFPVRKVVKPKEVSAENWLITAETGGGKSFYVKAILLQLLAMNYNGTIMDVEGFEYIPMAYVLSHHSKVNIINMGEGNGKYFDPMEIAGETGLEEVDRDAKQMSLNFTLAILKVLTGKVYHENLWMDTVLNDAVAETYKDFGITDDRETWKNSSKLTLFDVYEKLKRLESFRKNKEYKDTVNQALALVGKYFEEDGTRSSLFKEKVNVKDIVDADLIICSFGMAGKSPQAIDEVQLALMQLGAAQLSHQRSIFSKSQGKYNFKLWEEFQRWGKFPDSDKTLGVALTGGRKLGDVNIIVTNVIKELLDDDRFGIFGNTTSFCVGAIADDKVRADFCDRLSLPNMKPELDKLGKAAKDDGDDNGENTYLQSVYQYAFLCGLDRSKYGIVKMLLPEDISGTQLFKAGANFSTDTKKKEEEV